MGVPRVRRIVRYAATIGGVALAAPAASAAGGANWTQYLFGPDHHSYNRTATAITATNAGGLHRVWSWSPPKRAGETSGPRLVGSPTVADGRVYLGASDGWFYAITEATGKTAASANLGYITACSSPHGIESTAALAADPARHGALTVYVAAGAPGGSLRAGNYLWALDAGTLRRVGTWAANPVTIDSQQGSYALSSPTVMAGHVYVGISSTCDRPLVRGGVASIEQRTGDRLGTWWAVPAKRSNGRSGNIGGSVWSSVAVGAGTGSVFATTGNADEANLDGHGCDCARPGDSYSMVRVNGATMKEVDHWTDDTAAANAASQADEDFGGSPTIFPGQLNGAPTALLGACNKDGRYYVVRRDNLAAGLAWQFRAGAASGSGAGFDACLSAAAFDPVARQLVIGGNAASDIDGRSYPGSVRALSPDFPVAHRVRWDDGLACNVIGSPSINGNGLVATATYGSFSARTGTYLRCDARAGRDHGPACDDTDGAPHVYVLDGRSPVANPSGRPDAPVLWCHQLASGAFSQPTFADGYLLVASGATGPASAAARLTAFSP